MATLLADRAVLRLSATAEGEDVAGFLQGLVTSDMARPLPVWTALLSPQGKALFDFIVWSGAPGGGDLLIDCEAAVADALARRLLLYRLRRRIAIAPAPNLGVHWAPPGGQAPEGAVPDPRLAPLGMRWIGTAEGGDAGDAWHAHRLAQGVAEGVAELGTDRTLWLECNAAELNGVSFTKGCYVGQENTARMNWRQKVNRRLVVVPLEAADPARQRLAYPQLGWSVEHRRVEDLAGLALPGWLRSGLPEAAAALQDD